MPKTPTAPTNDTGHPDHGATIGRLNRIAGQIAGIRRMVEERRYCPEILAQTRAVQQAMKGLESEILRAHLEHCVRQAVASGDDAAVARKIDEIVTVFKRT